MSEESRRHIIAYDITDDKRRSHVAKKLQSYGIRAQYSVFLVDLRPAKLRRLLDSLEQLIDDTEDSVLVCDLGPVAAIHPSAFHYLGASRPEPSHGPVII